MTETDALYLDDAVTAINMHGATDGRDDLARGNAHADALAWSVIRARRLLAEAVSDPSATRETLAEAIRTVLCGPA